MLLLGTVGVFARAREHWGYVTDDAFISMQYASRFLQGHGLTWTSGAPPVEGYSNFLWVMALVALGATGLDLLVAVRVLGIACTWLLVALLVWRARAHPAVAALAIVALLASGTVTTWSVAGLEGPLVALLVVASAYAAAAASEGDSSPWTAGIALSALTLARVDGVLFAPIVAGCIGMRSPRLGASILALPVATFLAHTGFRWLYYGDVVPNVAHIKVEANLARFDHGLRYVGFALKYSWPLALGACVLGVWARGARIAILLTACAGWLAYLVFVGGDVFPSRRHMHVAVVVLVAALVEALRARRERWAFVVAIAAVAGFVGLQRVDPENDRADASWSRQALELGRTLRRAFGATDPLMAVRAAGALPYGSGFRCVDMLGLNDREIALAPVPVRDDEMIGHDHFNAALVLAREPDLIVNGNGARVQEGPMMEDLLDQPAFRDGYDLVPFRIGKGTRAWAYVRRDSPRIGVTREADRVAIPAWFFADADHFVRVRDEGSFVPLEPGGEVSFTLALEPGPWRGAARATSEVAVEVSDGPGAGDLVTVVVAATEATSLQSVELSRKN